MLNPAAVRSEAGRPVLVGILAADEAYVDRIHEFLFAGSVAAVVPNVLRVASEDDFGRVTVGFAEPGFPHPAHFCTFDEPQASANRLLDDHQEHWLALGRNFPGLRRSISERLIRKVARENTLFAVTTSLPNVVPTMVSLPWAVGEFASDTACLTANQVRLALLLAAVHAQEVGYDRQFLKIGSILGAAFGWRAIARQMVSKLPGGGGVVSKGLIAFAGTYAVGRSLEHWYREGVLMGSAEQRSHYAEARTSAKDLVERIVGKAISGSPTAAARPA